MRRLTRREISPRDMGNTRARARNVPTHLRIHLPAEETPFTLYTGGVGVGRFQKRFSFSAATVRSRGARSPFTPGGRNDRSVRKKLQNFPG